LGSLFRSAGSVSAVEGALDDGAAGLLDTSAGEGGDFPIGSAAGDVDGCVADFSWLEPVVGALSVRSQATRSSGRTRLAVMIDLVLMLMMTLLTREVWFGAGLAEIDWFIRQANSTKLAVFRRQAVDWFRVGDSFPAAP
jgi:hypothetical protein